MAKKDVDQDNVRISQVPDAGSPLKQLDDVIILVTQAFCPNGHNMVSDDNEQFDGYPGIRLLVKTDDRIGEVFLSPLHGDASKKGATDWEVGKTLEICCPVCEVPLPRVASCKCGPNREAKGDLVKLFLSPSLKESNIMAVCNVWGCRRSRTVDNWNIISEYLDGEIED